MMLLGTNKLTVCISELLDNYGRRLVGNFPLCVQLENQELYFCSPPFSSRVCAGFRWHNTLQSQLGYFFLPLIWQNEVD